MAERHPDPETAMLKKARSEFLLFPKLPIELRALIWDMYCPELKAANRFILASRFTKNLGGTGRCLFVNEREKSDLGKQTSLLRSLLAINRETRVLAQKAFPDTIPVAFRRYRELRVKDQPWKRYKAFDSKKIAIPFRKETDVIWIHWGYEIKIECWQPKWSNPGDLKTLLHNIGFHTPDGTTNQNNMYNLTYCAEQFPNVKNFWHQVEVRDSDWCFSAECASDKYRRWPTSKMLVEGKVSNEKDFGWKSLEKRAAALSCSSWLGSDPFRRDELRPIR